MIANGARAIVVLGVLACASAAWAQDCERGQLERCAAEARWFARPGPRRDPARVVALLRRGCDGGQLADCDDLGSILRRGIEGSPPRPQEALPLLSRLCAAGRATACAGLARTVLSDAGHTRVEARAVAALESACGQNAEEACVAVGAIYEQGWGRRRNDARARAAYVRACDAGNVASCTRAGWMFARGRGGPRAPDEASSRFERACQSGHSEACGRLAEMLEPRDAARARDLHDRACRAGWTRSCGRPEAIASAEQPAAREEPAVPQPIPEPTPRPETASACARATPEPCLSEGQRAWESSDWAAAAPALRTYCEAGRSRRDRALACHRAGVLHMEGRGVTADAAAAIDMLDQACAARIREACASAGVALASGSRGVSADPRRARRLLERAGDDAGAQRALALLLLQHGRSAERARALQELATACESGDADACAPAAEGYRAIPRGGPARAIALLDAGCRAGRGQLCADLGALQTDAAAASAAYARGCELGVASACSEAAQRIDITDDASRTRASSLLAVACEADDGAACLRAGELLLPVDPARASTLLARGCTADARPCLEQGRRLRGGETGARDREASGVLIAAACGASGEGCSDLAQLCDEGALAACGALGELCETGSERACEALTTAGGAR